jgi:uncharacterized coiled-coil DUF342 family protein
MLPQTLLGYGIEILLPDYDPEEDNPPVPALEDISVQLVDGEEVEEQDEQVNNIEQQEQDQEDTAQFRMEATNLHAEGSEYVFELASVQADIGQFDVEANRLRIEAAERQAKANELVRLGAEMLRVLEAEIAEHEERVRAYQEAVVERFGEANDN